MTRSQALAFSLLLLAYVAVSIAAGQYFGDSHLVNRLGAILSALGALMIIFQVRREVIFERRNRDDKIAIAGGKFGTADRARVENARLLRAGERHEQRMRIIVCIALMVFLGELLHGWGDVLLAGMTGTTHGGAVAGERAVAPARD